MHSSPVDAWLHQSVNLKSVIKASMNAATTTAIVYRKVGANNVWAISDTPTAEIRAYSWSASRSPICIDRVTREFDGEQEQQEGVSVWVEKATKRCRNNDVGDEYYKQPPMIAVSTPIRLLVLAPWSSKVFNSCLLQSKSCEWHLRSLLRWQ